MAGQEGIAPWNLPAYRLRDLYLDSGFIRKPFRNCQIELDYFIKKVHD